MSDSQIEPSAVACTMRSDICTPFGAPVVPEV